MIVSLIHLAGPLRSTSYHQAAEQTWSAVLAIAQDLSQRPGSLSARLLGEIRKYESLFPVEPAA